MSEHDFVRRIAAGLHAPVPASANARRAIMARVRSVPPHERPRARRMTARFTTRHSIAGLALAAGIGSVTTMSSLQRAPGVAHSGRGLASIVIGDSVSSTLRDTVRLVRLIFDDSTAHEVAAVGDFNGWRAEATPLQRVGTTPRWSATVALKDGAHRYAFVVDGTRWVPDPTSAPVRGDDGRLYSLLHVARTNN